MTGLDVEAVLRQHEAEHVNAYYCSCSDYRLDVPWTAHVAAVLRVEIAKWLSSERAQDAVADAMLDCNHNGMRCYDPVPIYPTAQAALSALTASLAATEGDRQ